jgi:hypothetical protein
MGIARILGHGYHGTIRIFDKNSFLRFQFRRRIRLRPARAGQDESPQLNLSIDGFLAKALIYNLPITLVNHAAAPHAFDLMHRSEATREIIREILAFMRFHLLAKASSGDRSWPRG